MMLPRGCEGLRVRRMTVLWTFRSPFMGRRVPHQLLRNELLDFYKCQNTACPHYSFQLDLLYKGRAPAIKEQIVDMSLNGSGIRDTARVLKISPTTVINTLKKKSLPLPR
jgi:hypothetical protein